MTLFEYFSTEHNILLLDSEIQDILSIARQEIELPDDEEIHNAGLDSLNTIPVDEEGIKSYKSHYEKFVDGVLWLRDKVRNPYPQTIKFK